ncbi:hypothetical protein MRX96_042835 [Rhipicephalus microplus]
MSHAAALRKAQKERVRDVPASRKCHRCFLVVSKTCRLTMFPLAYIHKEVHPLKETSERVGGILRATAGCNKFRAGSTVVLFAVKPDHTQPVKTWLFDNIVHALQRIRVVRPL